MTISKFSNFLCFEIISPTPGYKDQALRLLTRRKFVSSTTSPFQQKSGWKHRKTKIWKKIPRPCRRAEKGMAHESNGDTNNIRNFMNSLKHLGKETQGTGDLWHDWNYQTTVLLRSVRILRNVLDN